MTEALLPHRASGMKPRVWASRCTRRDRGARFSRTGILRERLGVPTPSGVHPLRKTPGRLSLTGPAIPRPLQK